jgi:hypothetical protein
LFDASHSSHIDGCPPVFAKIGFIAGYKLEDGDGFACWPSLAPLSLCPLGQPWAFAFSALEKTAPLKSAA